MVPDQPFEAAQGLRKAAANGRHAHSSSCSRRWIAGAVKVVSRR
jgi:hypothetical protein